MMTKTINVIASLLPGFLALFVLSCQREQLHETPHPDVLTFEVSEAIPDLQTKAGAASSRIQAGDLTLVVSERYIPVQGGETKASAVYTSSDAIKLNGNPIAVWAYNMAAADVNTPTAWKVDGGSTSPVQASYNGGKWVTSVPYNSSSRDDSWKTRWCAIAPYGAIGNGVTLGSIADGTAPSLSYTVPATSASQHDLMILSAPTAARGVNDKEDVNLTFIHALTGIKLVADDGVNISAATLSGVFDQASLNLMTGEWSGQQKSKATPSFSVSGFGTDESVMMMIPQWLPSGAKLTLTVDGTTVEADLSGHKWLKGMMVTYRVAGRAKEYHIEFETYPASALVELGRDVPIAKVHAYYTQEGSNVEVPSNWISRGIFYTKAGAIASDYSDRRGGYAYPESGPNGATPGEDGEDLIALFYEYDGGTTPTGPDPFTVTHELRSRQTRGTSSERWNLSNPYGGQDEIIETANTYLINAAGYYRIPLVIGNAIKNKVPNTAAYPSPFVDYKGAAISSPYLHKTSASAGTPDSATFVWEEAGTGVENLAVQKDSEKDLYWLTFDIQKANIGQGCTVVAVKDNAGTIMWSWLLWITDYELGVGDIDCPNAKFMLRNLGWSVEGSVDNYYGNDGWVRIEAVNEEGEYMGAYAVVFVHLAGEYSYTNYAGHGPYFQWGRKDAMPPTATGWASATSGNKKPEDLIQNPGLHFPNTLYPFISTGGNGGGLTEYNYWSASATYAAQDIATVKTVYDPCPAGYTVPRLNAFDNLGGSSWISGSGYAGRSFIGGALYLPAGGYRNQAPSNGDLSGSNTGRYWVAVAQGGTGNAARRLEINSSGVDLPSGGGNNQKPMEFSIRPAREE